MPVHVRVRDSEALRERMKTVGKHADVAMRAGLAPARLSQLLSGAAPVINVVQAAKLEDVLGVPRGTFFAFSDGDVALVADYLAGAAPADVPAPAAPAEDTVVDVVPVDGGDV